jgi:hypothetical protein
MLGFADSQCNDTYYGKDTCPLEPFGLYVEYKKNTAKHWRSGGHGGQNQLNHWIKGKNFARFAVLNQLLL